MTEGKDAKIEVRELRGGSFWLHFAHGVCCPWHEGKLPGEDRNAQEGARHRVSAMWKSAMRARREHGQIEPA